MSINYIKIFVVIEINNNPITPQQRSMKISMLFIYLFIYLLRNVQISSNSLWNVHFSSRYF